MIDFVELENKIQDLDFAIARAVNKSQGSCEEEGRIDDLCMERLFFEEEREKKEENNK